MSAQKSYADALKNHDLRNESFCTAAQEVLDSQNDVQLWGYLVKTTIKKKVNQLEISTFLHIGALNVHISKLLKFGCCSH